MQKMSAHAQTEQTDDNELKTRENNLDTPREKYATRQYSSDSSHGARRDLKTISAKNHDS